MNKIIRITLALITLLTVQQVYAVTYRNPTVIYNFKKDYPCPTDFIINGECYARVDHICALVNGGIDKVPNLQWQRYDLSLIKDTEEDTPAGKAKYCNSKNSTLTRQVFNKPRR